MVSCNSQSTRAVVHCEVFHNEYIESGVADSTKQTFVVNLQSSVAVKEIC